MEKKKKKWAKPKLIILARSRQAEGVLTYCKGYMITTGYMGYLNYCREIASCTLACSMDVMS